MKLRILTDVFLDTYALATVPFTVREQGLDEQDVVEERALWGSREIHIPEEYISTDGTHNYTILQ